MTNERKREGKIRSMNSFIYIGEQLGGLTLSQGGNRV